jgi:hypothetical protein
VKGRPTIEIAHPPGEEMQWDWLELPNAPSGCDAHLLVGSLPHSGKVRAVFADAEDEAHLVEALGAVLRRFEGTARRWRFDHMPGVVEIGCDRLLASFASVAKYYGVGIDICPPRRANRKGSVEKSNDFIAQRWWHTMTATIMVEAQTSLDRFLAKTGDARHRQQQTVGERAAVGPLRPLPREPYPATVEVERVVSAAALVAFRGNRYGVLPGLTGATVRVRQRLGSPSIEILSMAGASVTTHRLAPAGAGMLVRSEEHRVALEAAVFDALATAPPCRRKDHRPPGPEAQAAAQALRGIADQDVHIDLTRYAELAEGAR